MMAFRVADGLLLALLLSAGAVGYALSEATRGGAPFNDVMVLLQVVGTLGAVAAAVWIPTKIKNDEVARDDERDRRRLRGLIIYTYPAMLRLKAELERALMLFRLIMSAGVKPSAWEMISRFETDLTIELPDQLRMAVEEFELIAAAESGAVLLMPLSLVEHHAGLFKQALRQCRDSGNWQWFLTGLPAFMPALISADQGVRQAIETARSIYGSLPIEIKIPTDAEAAARVVADLAAEARHTPDSTAET
ncbi:MAG: hypothetical protein AB7E79_09675 [Rhodospirillaceae bacterium]